MYLKLEARKRIQIFLGILILSVSGCLFKTKSNNLEFGRQSRLVSSLIPMSCEIDNLAIYNEYYAYRLSKSDYELINFSDNIGLSEDVFSINFMNYKEELLELKNARISICENGKLFVGLPIFEGTSSYPPESHFSFRYDSLNSLKIGENGKLHLGSVKYISQKKY